MRLLDRYLLRELLIPLTYCLVGFLIFWISFDLFSELSEFQAKKLKGTDVAHYYLIKTPEMLSVVLPIALLLGLLYALTTHARYHELTAMRAAGVSLWRLSFGYIGVGLAFSVALFVINEFWVPKSYERAEELLNKYMKASTPTGEWKQRLFFRNESEGRLWQAAGYNLDTETLTNVHIVWNLPGGAWRDIYAETANWKNGVWSFKKVKEWNYRSQQDLLGQIIETNLVVRPEFEESPELIRSEIKVNSLNSIQAAKRPQLSIEEIRNYFRLHPNPPRQKAALLKTQLHSRIASPWTCLVVVLIAIPFGAPSGRRNVFVGVAASVFICFAYFILFRVGLALGTGGHITPWIAAWLPNLFFGAIGIYLTSRVR